ncbi:hypothetical protein SSYM_2081, partial [Serratia symbiotica str. Tucson]
DFRCCSCLTMEPNHHDILPSAISLSSHLAMNRAVRRGSI